MGTLGWVLALYTVTVVGWARARLEDLAQALQRSGAITDKLRAKKSIHKRMFTAVRVGYFDVESPEGDRYFLDPWNNPYWAHWKRKTGKLTLYSFGPDRQRDDEVSKPAVDDVRVVLELD